MTVTAPRHPVVMFAPYLPLASAVEIGEWWIGPIDQFAGHWHEPEFERLARTLVGAFRGRRGATLDHPSLVAHKIDGVSGEYPNEPERRALQAAVNFAGVDRNPDISHPNAGHLAITSDNTELHIWPIDLTSKTVTLSEGWMVRGLDGGWALDAKLSLEPPIELRLPMRPILMDPDIASAVYDISKSPEQTPDPALARRISVAIAWLSQAWRNTRSLRGAERVVMIKTGFEALSGLSTTHDMARWVEAQYRALEKAGATDLACRDILWSPSEAATLPWVHGKKMDSVTPLGHWLRWLGSVRNDILHNGKDSLPDYTERTPYLGHPISVGERLLRETIRVCLGELGYPDLWRTTTQRAGDRVLGLVFDGLIRANEAAT